MNKIIKFILGDAQINKDKNESNAKEKVSNKRTKPFYIHRNRWGFPTLKRKDK